MDTISSSPSSESSGASSLKSGASPSRDGLTADQAAQMSEDDWRARLNPQEFRVLRRAGTEPAFTGEYVDTKTTGVYRCRACAAKLFSSDTKFESHCGWPSFYTSIPDTVKLVEDRSFGMRRVEVRCRNCDSHLGHVFEGEGYPTPTDQRYCINSISLSLEPTP